MSLEQFFVEEPLYSLKIDRETRNRIRLSVAAYAYECMNFSLLSDEEFDELAYSIDLKVNTRRPDLDEWFRNNFEPHTGMWIHKHPEREKLRAIAKMIRDNDEER